MLEDDFIDCITPFDRKRNMPMIYELGSTKQLILKNSTIPCGVTIVGSQESIELFVNCFDALSVMGSGFYPFLNERPIYD